MPDTHPDRKIAKLLAERDAALSACSTAVKDRDEVIGEWDAVRTSHAESLASRDDIIADLARRLRLTKEEVDYLRNRLFGRKSEKLPQGPTLFDLTVPVPDGETPPLTVSPDETMPETMRRNNSRRRNPRRRP